MNTPPQVIGLLIDPATGDVIDAGMIIPTAGIATTVVHGPLGSRPASVYPVETHPTVIVLPARYLNNN